MVTPKPGRIVVSDTRALLTVDPPRCIIAATMSRSLLFSLLAMACDDAPSGDVDADVHASGDVAVDAAPAPDAAAPIEAAEALPLEAPAHLDAGESVEWEVPPRGASAIQVKLRAWRWEDSRLRISAGAQTREAWVFADAGGGWRWVREAEGEGYGVEARSPVWRAPASDAPWRLALESLEGGAIVEAVRVVDPRAALPADVEPAPPESMVVEVAPCGAGCDDAEGLAVAIDSAAEGPVTLRLEGTYTLRTSLTIRREDVHLRGGTLVWDPAEDLRWGPAVRFVGGGPGAEAPLVGAHRSGARRFLVQAPQGWAPTHVLFAADDFGPVPPPCESGRDVERFDRHIHQLVGVSDLERTEAGLRVTVDRAVHLEVPADANPRLVEVTLLPGARISDVHLVAACPEALEHEGFGSPECANPGVVDDRGVVFQWTEGARAERVSAQAFGKEAILVDRALSTRITGCQMDHPARYGGGGQGYGVHTTRASRTVVRGQRVEHARHGVVIDFGSSDTQVLGGRFSDTSQALIDIHGEASRDTLVRGNALSNAQAGIIVGGGGRAVHCNDGPRHHLQHNSVSEAGVAAISVVDYTREVYARFNDLRGGAVLLFVAFGGGDVHLEGNRLGPSSAAAVNVLGEGSGGVRLRRNLFEVDCDPRSAVLVAAGGEPPEMVANRWCPE